MNKLFGTDGIRGVANSFPMDSETLLRLGRAVAATFSGKAGIHRIVIGKDTRLSGYMLETALASGLTSMGADVLLVGPIPTPAVAYLTRTMRADAGAMISASHNHFEDNGIKFFGEDGFKLDDTTEAQIEKLMQPGVLDSSVVKPSKIGKAFRIDDASGRYIDYLKSCIESSMVFDGMKVVVDCANGAAYKVAPTILRELEAKVVSIGDSPDGLNINEGYGSLYPEKISQKVKEVQADCDISFDGDADRVIFCDENGVEFDGDLIMALLAQDLQSRGKLKGGGIVGTVMSNLGLEVFLNSIGLDLHRSGVGDRYVLMDMINKGVNFGGEQSGHVISLDHNTTGDGILTALLILSALKRSGKPLSYFQGLVKRYPQILINIKVSEKVPFEDIPNLSDLINSSNKRLAGKGRLLLRYSGTENKARVMVECSDAAMCESVANEVAEAIKKELSAE